VVAVRQARAVFSGAARAAPNFALASHRTSQEIAVSLIFFETRETPLIEPADFDPVETVTRRLTPPHLRRPPATGPGKRAAARDSFASISGSDELPLIGMERPRPDETARIVIGRLVDDEPAPPAETRRPRWYRGTRRLDHSRAALLAARGGIGGSW
jgi:hypothetical protein